MLGKSMAMSVLISVLMYAPTVSNRRSAHMDRVQGSTSKLKPNKQKIKCMHAPV